MSTGITRDEFLAHIGYVRGDVAKLQASVDQVAERTAAHATAIALLEQQQTAAAARQAQRRTSADAIVVAVLGASLAGAIEWIKARVGR